MCVCQRFRPIENQTLRGGGQGLNRNTHADLCDRQGTESHSVCPCVCWQSRVYVRSVGNVQSTCQRDQRGEPRWRQQNTQFHRTTYGAVWRNEVISWLVVGKVQPGTMLDKNVLKYERLLLLYMSEYVSLQINRMCVRRFCYHGGLLEIDARMHAAEAACYCATACLLIQWSLQYICSRLSSCIFICSLPFLLVHTVTEIPFWAPLCFGG